MIRRTFETVPPTYRDSWAMRLCKIVRADVASSFKTPFPACGHREDYEPGLLSLKFDSRNRFSVGSQPGSVHVFMPERG